MHNGGTNGNTNQKSGDGSHPSAHYAGTVKVESLSVPNRPSAIKAASPAVRPGSMLPAPATHKLHFDRSDGPRRLMQWARKAGVRFTMGAAPTTSLASPYDDSMSDTSADWANPGSPRSKHRPSPRRNASSNTCRGDSATMSPARSGLNEIRRSASRESSSVDDDVEVDQVVVDNDWSSWEGADAKSEILSTTGLRRQSSHYSRRSDSVANDNIHGSDDLAQSTSPTWHTLRYRVYPAVKYFFDQSFEDREREAQFQREIWWNGKLMCFIGALYFLLNFILYAADAPKPDLYDKILFFGVAPLLSITHLLLVLFNWPRKHNYVWQVFAFMSVWFWPLGTVAIEYSCGYFAPGPNTCGPHTFTTQGLYATGYPVLALMVMRASRLSVLLGTIVYVTLVSVMILPVDKGYTRTMVDFVIYVWIFILISFIRERSDRGLSTLRNQLKLQFKATQEAQIAERKAHSARKRFSNYIFHEVRVPLNNAMLALQTLEADQVFKKTANSDHEIEYAALNGSLIMMSKVLNDVLGAAVLIRLQAEGSIQDFNRMESGKLERVSAPFNLHDSIMGNLGVLKVAAGMKRIDLSVQLDDRIDQLAHVAANQARYTSRDPEKAASPQRPGLVVGDEMRIKQVMNNICANAIKFTSNGGKVRFVTKLVHPAMGDDKLSSQSVGEGADASAATAHNSQNGASSITAVSDTTPPVTMSRDDYVHLEKGYSSSTKQDLALIRHSTQPVHESSQRAGPNFLVIRIEVHDTGPGLRLNDVVDGKLFSPYVQTTIGKLQGGKGTGLGLALVRQIVQLSKGRLGVKSRVGSGSCFWVEFPLEIGCDAIDRTSHTKQTSPTFGTEISNHSTKRPDGSLGPLRPVPNMRINFSHTESTFSQHSPEQNLFSPQHEQHAYSSVGIFSPGSTSSSYGWPSPDTPVSPYSQLVGMTRPLQTITSSKEDLEGNNPANGSCHDVTTKDNTAVDRVVKQEKDEHEEDHHKIERDVPEGTVLDGTFMSCIRDTSQLSKHLEETSRPTCGAANDAPPALSTSQSKAAHENTSAEPPLKVLVVDDDPLTRTLMSRTVTRILKDSGGVTLVTAEHGGAAVEYLLGCVPAGTPQFEYAEPPPMVPKESHNVDIILLDHQMPVLTGLQVARELRRVGRNDLIVGVTANASKEDQDEFIVAGADHVLTKPVAAASLKKMLEIAKEQRSTNLKQSLLDHTIWR